MTDLNPRRDYDASSLDSGPADVRDTYQSRQDDIALQSEHTADLEREDRETVYGKGGFRGLINRLVGALRRRS